MLKFVYIILEIDSRSRTEGELTNRIENSANWSMRLVNFLSVRDFESISSIMNTRFLDAKYLHGL